MKTGIFGEECQKLGLGIHITTYKTGAFTKSGSWEWERMVLLVYKV
jgi:hypothetical protein